jgi:hypothetical protein
MVEAGSAQQGSMYASKWNIRSTRLSGCRQRQAPVLHLTPVAVYVEATNGFDLERWMAAFAHDALINVGLQAYCEKPATSECAKRDYHRWQTDDECSHSDQPLGNLIVAARWTVIAMSAAYLIRWPPFMSAPE